MDNVNYATLSNINENNDKYYYDNGTITIIKNLNDEIDISNSKNIDINNNSLMLFNTTGSQLSNINITGINESLSVVLEFSSRIDISNFNVVNAIGMLLGYDFS